MRSPTGYLFLVLIASCVTAFAQTEPISDGNTLKQNCAYAEKAEEPNGNAGYQAFACVAYISGVIDGYQEAEPKYPLCYPAQVTVGQMADVVMKFLRDHPEELHKPAGFLVLRAIGVAFPCKNK
jgi:hypothetical protein